MQQKLLHRLRPLPSNIASLVHQFPFLVVFILTILSPIHFTLLSLTTYHEAIRSRFTNEVSRVHDVCDKQFISGLPVTIEYPSPPPPPIITKQIGALALNNVRTKENYYILRWAAITFALSNLLHFAAIDITFCVDYYILRRSNPLKDETRDESRGIPI